MAIYDPSYWLGRGLGGLAELNRATGRLAIDTAGAVGGGLASGYRSMMAGMDYSPPASEAVAPSRSVLERMGTPFPAPPSPSQPAPGAQPQSQPTLGTQPAPPPPQQTL